MEIEKIIWLDEIIEKLIIKHNVQQNEVEEIFTNYPHFRFVEKGHIPGENVYSAMGQTNNGCYLIIFFIHKKNKYALILSARNMISNERRLYERK